MALYYVNDNSQDDGYHEVHKEGCSWLSMVKSKTSLGSHFTCHSAVSAAKKYYSHVDGCKYCCLLCHTR